MEKEVTGLVAQAILDQLYLLDTGQEAAEGETVIFQLIQKVAAYTAEVEVIFQPALEGEASVVVAQYVLSGVTVLLETSQAQTLETYNGVVHTNQRRSAI